MANYTITKIAKVGNSNNFATNGSITITPNDGYVVSASHFTCTSNVNGITASDPADSITGGAGTVGNLVSIPIAVNGFNLAADNIVNLQIVGDAVLFRASQIIPVSLQINIADQFTNNGYNVTATSGLDATGNNAISNGVMTFSEDQLFEEGGEEFSGIGSFTITTADALSEVTSSTGCTINKGAGTVVMANAQATGIEVTDKVGNTNIPATAVVTNISADSTNTTITYLPTTGSGTVSSQVVTFTGVVTTSFSEPPIPTLSDIEATSDSNETEAVGPYLFVLGGVVQNEADTDDGKGGDVISYTYNVFVNNHNPPVKGKVNSFIVKTSGRVSNSVSPTRLPTKVITSLDSGSGIISLFGETTVVTVSGDVGAQFTVNAQSLTGGASNVAGVNGVTYTIPVTSKLKGTGSISFKYPFASSSTTKQYNIWIVPASGTTTKSGVPLVGSKRLLNQYVNSTVTLSLGSRANGVTCSNPSDIVLSGRVNERSNQALDVTYFFTGSGNLQALVPQPNFALVRNGKWLTDLSQWVQNPTGKLTYVTGGGVELSTAAETELKQAILVVGRKYTYTVKVVGVTNHGNANNNIKILAGTTTTAALTGSNGASTYTGILQAAGNTNFIIKFGEGFNGKVESVSLSNWVQTGSNNGTSVSMSNISTVVSGTKAKVSFTVNVENFGSNPIDLELNPSFITLA